MALICLVQAGQADLPFHAIRIPNDYDVPEPDVPAAPTEAETEDQVSACFCEKRKEAGRDCETKDETEAKTLAEVSAKGCDEELRGMPDNDFKKQAVRDCVCRVLESSGFPCVDPEAVKKNEEADAGFKAACVDQAAINAADPAKAAVEQRACLCDWAKDVIPGLCGDASGTRNAIASIVEDCKKDKGKEDSCICSARAADAELPDCKTEAEWKKIESAVSAKHATCGKVNRRRRGVPGPPVNLPPAPPKREVEEAVPEEEPEEEAMPTAEAEAEDGGEDGEAEYDEEGEDQYYDEAENAAPEEDEV